MSQEARNLPDMEEFQEIMDGICKEPNVDEKIGSALTCLANAQNKIYIQLENPSTELSASRIDAKAELTRL